MRRINMRAIGIGAAVDCVGSFLLLSVVFGVLAGAWLVAQGREVGEQAIQDLFDPSDPLGGLWVVVGSYLSVLGGYVAARIANHAEILHAGLAGALSAVVLTMLDTTTITASWVSIMLSVLTVPLAMLGGYARTIDAEAPAGGDARRRIVGAGLARPYAACARIFAFQSAEEPGPTRDRAELVALLRRPREFFQRFARRRLVWGPAVAGFYLAGLSERGTTAAPLEHGALLGSVAGVLTGAVMAGSFLVLSSGVVWMHLGSRMVGGKSPVARTVQAVGYAWFWPGLFATLFVVPLDRAAQALAPSWTVVSWASGGLQFGVGAWFVLNEIIAVRHLNGFSRLRTTVLVLWPVVGIGVVLGATYVVRALIGR